MKNTILRRIFAIGVTSALLVGALAGCGSSSSEETTASGSAAGSAAAESSDDVQVITVGSGVAYKPFAYLDDDGEAIGYEYDVLAAIDEALPQYEFQYESMNFDNLLLSLDAGKLDFVAHQYEYTDERAEKYLFSTEYYNEYVTRITVGTDNNDTINSIDDLSGKTVNGGGATSATYSILTSWNENNPDKEPINVLSSDSVSNEETVTSITSGAWYATVSTEQTIVDINAEYDNVLKAVGDPVNVTYAYYVFPKGSTELRDAIDEGLRIIRENGTLSEISEKWFSGVDYSGDGTGSQTTNQ